VADTVIGDQGIEAVSQSLPNCGVFSCRIRLRRNIVSGETIENLGFSGSEESGWRFRSCAMICCGG